jgi:hypothetical protein
MIKSVRSRSEMFAKAEIVRFGFLVLFTGADPRSSSHSCATSATPPHTAHTSASSFPAPLEYCSSTAAPLATAE